MHTLAERVRMSNKTKQNYQIYLSILLSWSNLLPVGASSRLVTESSIRTTTPGFNCSGDT